MKSRANAKEGKERGNSNIISHGEFNLKRHSLWFIIFTGIIFFFAVSAYAEVERLTLDNGMVVLLKENRNQPLVNLFLCLRVGSAREGKFSGCGISHFIEHMVFKGTAARKAGDVFKEVESYGGKVNAFTSYDYTGYNITVPGEFALPALEILVDMTMNTAFDSRELKMEKQVVLKEIGLNYDNPRRYASRLLWESAYSTHPYKYPILGEEDLFSSLTREDLLEFHQARYTPSNMILAVVGDVEKEAFMASTKRLFKNFQQKSIIDSESVPQPQQEQLRSREEKFTAGMGYLLLGFHSVAITDEDCFALDVLGAILGAGKSSRLYKLLCDRKRLAYSIEATNYTPREPGLFIISCFLEERHRARALSLILEQTKLVKRKKIAENELESAKNKIISDVLFDNQTIEAQAQDLALNEALTGDFRFTEKYIRKIQQVNSQDILRVANKYLLQSNLSIVALIPRDESAKFNSLKSSSGHLKIGIEHLSADTDKALTVKAAPQQQAKGAKKYILANGLTILVRENKDLPLVSIKAVFKGGLRAENQNINGLCNLVAQMLDKATTTKSAAEIAYLVESKGAHLTYFSGNNSFGLSLDLLSRDFDEMSALLADLITSSTFSQRELKRAKEKNLAQLKAREDDIFESGMRLLKTTLFQKHPYRFLTIGNEESLKKIKRRDLINFYRRFCVGKNMVLAVFGDVDAGEALVKLKELFAGLKAGDIPRIAPDEEPRIETNAASSFKSLPKKQSLLLLGFHGTTVFARNRYAIEVICEVLSQASGRLFTQIREKRGLAYTLGAYSVSGLDPGYIVIYAATLAENVETVKREILRQLRLLKQKPLTEQELTQTKRALIGKKLISRQTNSACALESSLDELYGLGYNRYLEYSDRINRTTPEDVVRCANRYFDFNNYAVVIVGPRGKVEE